MTDVIFIAISGSTAYGWAKDNSDLDLYMVWAPNWKLAVGLDRNDHGKHKLNLALDITKYTIHHYLSLLAKGNSNLLENLFQPKVLEDTEAVQQLKQICLNNLHVGYLKHYYGYSKSMLHDINVQARIVKRGKIKPLLDCFRVINAGIILATRKEVVYNLQEQLNILPNKVAQGCLDWYLNSPFGITDELENKIQETALDEIHSLRATLKVAIDSCNWAESNREVFNEWLGQYYKKMRD